MNSEIIALFIVLLTVGTVVWLGKQQSKLIKTILNWFPAILFSYVIPATFTHIFKWDLSSVHLHTLSKEWVIPFAILLVMSALSFSQLRIVGLKPIVLFVSGSLVIAVLPVLLVLIFGVIDPAQQEIFVEQAYWKGLVPIVGGWIGGSTSQLVLKELINTPESLFLSILVLDNILVNIWTILMFQFIRRSETINRFCKISDVFPPMPGYSEGGVNLTSRSRLLTLTIVILMVVIVNLSVTQFLWKIIALSLLGLFAGNLIRNWNHQLVLKAGGVLIILIMAILGLKLNFSNLVLPGGLILLVVIWLLLHFVLMLIVARLLKINMAWVPIASMANLGGISTAPAVTAAYKEELMPHAILLAILSMVTGTAWGMFTIYLFGLL
ncbi:MAG: hypothetical protein Roseis2KO_33810 [Roseivirga sp.]